MRFVVKRKGGALGFLQVVVLWVSRHRPLEAQVRSLRERLGGDVEIVHLPHAPSADYVLEKAREIGAEYIVPVLPLSFIAHLAERGREEGFSILFARMEQIAATRNPAEARRLVEEDPSRRTAVSYPDGTIRVFEFKRFERVRKVELVTEPF